MVIAWDALQKRHDDLVSQLLSPALEGSRRHELQKEIAHLAGLLTKHALITNLEHRIQETKEQAKTNTDAELAELFAQEQADLTREYEQEQAALEDLMFPPDELDNRSVFLEIRAGAGGKEAALFAADLLKMYTNYALSKGWKVAVESSSSTDLGGLREVILHIRGKEVYGYLKQESGVHRVQRVPETETQGRIHTSTATVAVLPEAEEVDVTINPSDLRIDVYR